MFGFNREKIKNQQLTGRYRHRANWLGDLILEVEIVTDLQRTNLNYRKFEWIKATLKHLKILEEREYVNPSTNLNPILILAGIREFGLAADGSDLRDLEIIYHQLTRTRQAIDKRSR